MPIDSANQGLFGLEHNMFSVHEYWNNCLLPFPAVNAVQTKDELWALHTWVSSVDGINLIIHLFQFIHLLDYERRRSQETQNHVVTVS